MRTWWIINSGQGLRIEHAHEDSWVLRFLRKVGHGPFWTCAEAMRVLEYWTK